MGRMGSFDCRGLEQLQRQMEETLNEGQRQQFVEECAKELAARLLAKVIKRTPVGRYPSGSGKKGGTLKRGWTIGEPIRENGMVKIEVINPVEYASYVEYGHRQEPGRYVPAIGKRLKKGWVEGKFMLTISEQEIQAAAPAILEQKLQDMLRDVMS